MIGQRDLYLDLETEFGPDIAEVGAYTYTAHPETVLDRVAYQFADSDEVKVWRAASEPVPSDLEAALAILSKPYSDELPMRLKAYNAEFEFAALNNLYCKPRGLPPLHRTRIECLMVRAMLSGIRPNKEAPSLDDALELSSNA